MVRRRFAFLPSGRETLSGSVSLVLLAIAVVLIVLATGKWKVNAFVVLIVIAFAYGLAIGLPAADVVKAVREGFGGTLTYIGIVIVAGTIMGYILEKTGAALVMTQTILNAVGHNRAPLAMSIAGYVVSIPVFCDSGYVILAPLNRALSAETKTSMGVMAVALATGLYTTHTMVPPTPGPLAAEAYARAIAGKQDFAEGNSLLKRRDAEGAIRAFRRAAEADPTDFVALNNLGTLLLNHARDKAGAAQAFEGALQLSDQALVRANLAAARADDPR